MYKPFSVLKRIIVTLLIISGLLSAFPLLAQQPLGKTVSIVVSHKPIDTVLASITRQARVQFSYVGTPFKKDSLVTLNARNKNVRQVLDMLFSGYMQYIESGDNIILQRTDVYRERNYTVTGYVRDRHSGNAISNASVYERSTLISTFTDGAGYFHLRLKDKGRQPSVQLTISKELYLDTALYIMPGFDREISINISPAQPVMLREFTVSDQVDRTWAGKRFLSAELRRQTQNISRFFADKPFQSSIVPSVGTHGKMAGQVVNKVSMNLIGGYSMGLDGAEVAGGFNINRKDVQYFQAAGIFNVVGGNMTGGQFTGGVNNVMGDVAGAQGAGVLNMSGNVSGAQMAGFISRAKGNVSGLQSSGLINTTNGKLDGMQAAGLFNSIQDSLYGLQTAGIVSFTGKGMTGLQASGVINFAGGESYGLQASGFANVVRNGSITGAQITGGLNIVHGDANALQVSTVSNFSTGSSNTIQFTVLYNHIGKGMRGVQFAGLVNNNNGVLYGAQIAALGNRSRDTVRGLQLGSVNYAKHLKGIQFGLVNIADTSEGYGIALVNIVRKGGYYKLDLSNSDIAPMQFSFKSGRKQFYAILTGGYDPGKVRYAAGWGLGHVFSFTRRLTMAAEAVQHNIFDKDWKSHGNVYRLQPLMQFAFNRWISLHAGPALNYSDTFSSAKFEKGNGGFWVGWQAGVSLF